LALYYPEGAANYTPAIDNLFPVPQLASLTLSPATVTSGASSIATLTLNGPYAGGPITVTLLCDVTGWERLPTTLTIPAGSGASNFTVNSIFFCTPFKPAQSPFMRVMGE